MFAPPYGGRTLVLSIFHFFQTFGYYGFAAWVPTLLIAKGVTLTRSLEWASSSRRQPDRPLAGDVGCGPDGAEMANLLGRARHRRVRTAVLRAAQEPGAHHIRRADHAV